MRQSSLLLGGSLISTALALPTLPLDHIDLVERDGPVFDGYIGCTPPQIDTINQAFEDTLKLVALPSQLSLSKTFTEFTNPCTGICSEGSLETRFWGKGIADRDADYTLIQTVYQNIANLRSQSSKIRVSCVEQRSPLPGEQTTCAEVQGKAAYAFGTSKQYSDNTIVFCPRFFESSPERLGLRESELARDSTSRKDPNRMYSKAAALIHELSHLPAIENLDKTIITDLKNNPVDGYREKAYGIRLVEKLARRFPTYAARNADNYAWYATEIYFSNQYGLTDAAPVERGDDETAEPDVLPKSGRGLNVVLYETVASHQGGAGIDHYWKFFTIPQGHGVDCSLGTDPVVEINPEGPSDAHFGHNLGFDSRTNIPWPGGEYKLMIDGQECHYKCDGTNAGRLFCPTREIACEEDRASRQYDEVQRCNGYTMLKANVYCPF